MLRQKLQTQVEKRKDDFIKIMIAFGIEAIDASNFSNFELAEYQQLNTTLNKV